MKHTYIILLILLHLGNITISMEEPQHNPKKEDLITLFDLQQLHDPRYSDIKKEIPPHIIGIDQWWYLDRTLVNDDQVLSVYFNPSEDHVAAGSSRHASIFKIDTQKKIISFPHILPVTSICFSPEGQHLATASGNNVSLFDLHTQKQSVCLRHDGAVLSMCFNKAGTLLATGSTDNQACIFDANTEKVFLHNAAVTSIDFDQSGKQCATGCDDKNAYIYDVETYKEIGKFPHYYPVKCVSRSPNNEQLATACGRNAYVFNITTKKEIALFPHKATVLSIAFDKSGKYLMTISYDNNAARIFDITQQKMVACIPHASQVLSACLNAAGNRLVTGSFDSKVRIFARHEHYTLEQLLFKKWLLQRWLPIEKPNKELGDIKNLSKAKALLFADVASKGGPTIEELETIFATFFSKNMQRTIIRSMQHKITIYGK